MKCPTCGQETKLQIASIPDKDIMLYVAGSNVAFRCPCGCNVFRFSEQTIDGICYYECNGCSRLYEGEK